jgi:hypothetical protein
LQGIAWERLNQTRESYRVRLLSCFSLVSSERRITGPACLYLAEAFIVLQERRLQEYRNYLNLEANVEEHKDALAKECKEPAKASPVLLRLLVQNRMDVLFFC